MKTRERKNTDCCIVEVDFPEIDREQEAPLIGLLAELLAKERIRELEESRGCSPTQVGADNE